jgi:cytochrome b
MPHSPHGPKTRVWDLPTRLFHWAFAGLLVFSFISGKAGKLEWHMVSGKLILALLLFRIAWGFAGGGYARFAQFVKGPGETLGYALAMLRGTARRYLGHNPLGGWSILAMLALVALQAGTGLFATDDIYTDGPLAHLVSDGTKKSLTTIHRTWIDYLAILVGLHVLAALFYTFVKKDNLIVPMVTGDKKLNGATPPVAGSARPWLAWVLILAALALVFGLLKVYGK